jgi:hypothetical protein
MAPNLNPRRADIVSEKIDEFRAREERTDQVCDARFVELGVSSEGAGGQY